MEHWGIDADEITIISKADPLKEICYCCGIGTTQDEDAANAKLIAAAPDFYTECRALLDNILAFNDYQENIDRIQRLLEQVEAK